MTKAVAADLPQLLTLKDACIAGCAPTALSSGTRFIQPQRCIGSWCIRGRSEAAHGPRRTGTATMRKDPFVRFGKLLTP